MSLLVTGAGVVSSIGIGKDAFIASLIKGASGIKDTINIFSEDIPVARVADFDFGALFDDRRFRRVAAVTQYALVAAKEALKEAGLDLTGYDGKRVGVVCGVTHGALGYSCDFYKGFSTEGPLGASPVLFSDSVLNAPAGALSLAYGIKGPMHTLVGGPDVGVQAIEYGAELVRDGKVDACLVVSAEALHKRTVEAYVKLGLAAARGKDGFVMGEGAGAVVIERGEVAEGRLNAEGRGVKAIAELASVATMIAPEVDEALRGAAGQALKEAGLSGSDMTGVILGGDNGGVEACAIGGLLPDAVSLPLINELVGEAFCAGTLMGVIAAACFIGKGGELAEGLNLAGTSGAAKSAQPDGPDKLQQNILYLTAGHRKEAGCLILKRS